MENKIENNNQTELNTIIAYAQLAYHTLQHSGTDINPKTIRSEIKMFYQKFGNKEVRKLANSIVNKKK